MPKGYTKNSDSLDVMKETVLLCILKVHPSMPSQTSQTPPTSEPPSHVPHQMPPQVSSQVPSAVPSPPSQSEEQESDFEGDDEVNTDNEDTYEMPCCSVIWDEDGGYTIVQCNKCYHWLHIGQLGDCSGESCTLQQARSRSYYHVCTLCGRL